MGAIGDHPLLCRCIWIRGNAFVEYARVWRRDGSYVIDICVQCAGKSDIMHSAGLIVVILVLVVMIALIVLMSSSCSIIDLNDVKR